MAKTAASPVLRVGLAQINPRVGDLAYNVGKVEEFLARAEHAGCDLVAFPELTLSGYPPEDLVLKAGFVADNRAALEKVAARSGGCAVIVGFVDVANDEPIERSSAKPPRLFNAAAVCANGSVVGVYHKQLLPNYSVFDEARYFAAGHDDVTLYDIAGVAVSLSICEDVWIADGPVSRQRAAGSQLCVNINGSPFDRAKSGVRERTIIKRVEETGLPIAYVNQVCGQDELVFDGGSLLVDATGTVVARADHFAEELVVVDVAVPEPRVSRSKPVAQSKFVTRAGARTDVVSTRLAPVADEHDGILSALALGTRDYVHKNGFTDVVLGLSGGIDSALVAAIAVDALGAEHVHGVSMPSRYSSEGSQTDAAVLAGNLGIDLLRIPIEPAFAAYLEMTAETFGGREADLTEENLQSRVRGTTLMALSNKFGWMVLTTGNKSELAVGYFTLYGDSVGGFAVIKDIFKTDVYALSRRVNDRAGREIVPESTLTKPPSAELRPDQRDDQSLPPYDVLDAVLKLYVEDDRTAAEIIAHGFDESLVRRIVRLVDNNEYKRRQLPPGVRVTSKAFGKDRRLPITNAYRG
ncbi:MAG: NAD+ synthase [Ilumatobacteraceae bacterium]